MVTVTVLVPVVHKMSYKINPDNFCKFLALVNFTAYNFGYHVHEKAIQMVYIPLLISTYAPSTVKPVSQLRVHLLGILMVWSFCPLIPGYPETALKNLLLAG